MPAAMHCTYDVPEPRSSLAARSDFCLTMRSSCLSSRTFRAGIAWGLVGTKAPVPPSRSTLPYNLGKRERFETPGDLRVGKLLGLRLGLVLCNMPQVGCNV